MPAHWSMPVRVVAVALAGLGLATVTWAAVSDPPISASVAALFIGEKKVVEGTVSAAERDGNVVHLRLGDSPQALTVSLIIGLLSHFPAAPEQHYLGQAVRVVGTIRSFKDRPEMVIHDPANIQVVGAAPAQPLAAPPASADTIVPPAATPSLSERLDTLNERLRTLEERVERLEHSQ